MKVNKYLMKVLFSLFFFIGISQGLKAQVTLTDSMSNVDVCYAPSINRLTFNGTTGSSGQYVDVRLPNGFTFEGFLNGSVTGGGTVSYSGIFSGFHRFSISGGSGNPTVIVRFKQMARCGAGTSSFTARDSVRFFNGSTNYAFSGTAFNGRAPSLSITSISNTPSLATVGTTVTRQYTVTNGGFGPTGDFVIVDKASSLGQFTINTSSFVVNPSGSNYSIPGSSVSTSGDSIIVRFKKSLIADAGIGNSDSFFQNSESFVLRYTMVVNTCAIPTITSQLLAAWQCPGEVRCNWFNVNTGISTFGPALPNIVQLTSLRRRNDCFDGTTVWRDTLVLRNNSSGAATDIQIDAGGTRGSAFRIDLPGAYFDTASLRIRIGRNGASVRPNFTLLGTLTSSYAGCNFTGRPNHVRFTVPYLGPGDTLYIMMGQVQCNYTKSCIVNQSNAEYRYFNGLGINFNYKNACGNATFSGGWMDAQTYRDHYYDFSNTGPLSLSDGQTGDLSLEIGQINFSSAQRLLFANRAYREVTVIKPNVIIWDPAFSRPVYFEHPTNGILYPYYRSTNGDTFKFRITNTHFDLGTVFHAKVKGQCDGVTCSGILQYQIIFSHNPDTTYCTRENPEFCLDYPIAWASSCVVCCPKGMVNLKYDLTRINLGLGDDDNNGLPSGAIDKSLINLRRAIPGDTVEFVHKFYLKTDGTDPQWDYLRSIMKVSNTGHFSVVSDSVFVDRLTGSDSVFAMTPSTLGADKFVTDISSMPPFQQGDTVLIKLKLRVLVNSLANVVSFNTQVDGGASNDNFVTNYACGAIIDKLEIYGVDAFGYISHVGIVNGCQPYDFYPVFYTRIGPGNATYSNFRFPYEYRPLAQPLRMKLKIPVGYSVVDLITWNTNYPNQPLSSNYPQGTNIPFSHINDTIYFDVRNLYTTNGGLITIPDEGAWIQFRVRLLPSCTTPSGTNLSFAQLDSFRMLTPLTNSAYNMGIPNPQLGSTLANFHPNVILSSAIPIATAYSKEVSWPLSINNLTAFSATDNWLYIVKPSGLVAIDSVKEGSNLIVPDVNGFYRYGTLTAGQTRNFVVYGKSNACNFDSVLVYPGWSCGGNYPTSFSTSTCGRPALPLYVQPQPAAIQTQISALALTPRDPSDGASTDFGSSDVTMCRAFPAEMEIQSTQPGTIFKVKQFALVPFNNGANGVDLLTDSVYIEYPIGTTPRLADLPGITLMNSTLSSGSMLLDLEKLDSVNFNANEGLPGTGLGTSTTRRVIVRWKMRTNCNIVSGDQWNLQQSALAPCGSPAQGNNTITSGYPIDIAGVSKPYIVVPTIIPRVGGCSSGNCDTTQIKLLKIGAVAPTSTDSVFIKVPSNIQIGSIYCSGVNCPGGASGNISNISQVVNSGIRTITFVVPSDFDNNNDTLLLLVQAYEPSKTSCQSALSIQAGVRIPATLVCNAVPCPASNANLGVSTQQFNVNKPIITFGTYTAFSNAPYAGPLYNYEYALVVNNAGDIKTNQNIVFKSYFDTNNDGLLNAGDQLADSYTFTGSIAKNASLSVGNAFQSTTFPSTTLGMLTMLDTTTSSSCMCTPMISSGYSISLPISILDFKVQSVNCQNIITWKAESNESNIQFVVQKSIDGFKWLDIEIINRTLIYGVESFMFTDAVSTNKSYYRIKVVNENKQDFTRVVYIDNACLNQTAGVKVSPNPVVSGPLNIELSAVLEGVYNIEILDLSGKTVVLQSKDFLKGEHLVLLNIDDLSKGIYTLKISHPDGFSNNFKIIKQ